MKIKLDLHIHSAASADGRMSPDEILYRCREEGLQGAAVCDHDRVMSEDRADADFLWIPGVEVSTDYGHLLGLFVTVPIPAGDFVAAVEAIHAAGGIAVLAHPFARRREGDALLPILPLLDGIEVYNSRAMRKNSRANVMAEEFAAVHGLCRFAGSDAHVAEEVGMAYVLLEADELSAEAVKAALLERTVEITGRRSPARYTAMSQLTRRRRQGASPLSYAKWALFALRCLLQDLLWGGQ